MRCAARAPTTTAKRLPIRRTSAITTRRVSALDLRPGDIVLVEAGDLIPGDGDIIEGVASVNEAAVTGESAPVIREAGGDRSAVTGGTTVLSDWIVVRITSAPGSSFLDRMIALVEGAERQKTPNEIALNILLAGMTIVFLVAVVTLDRASAPTRAPTSPFTVLVALLVTLIPTTIGGLLSAIGIAGMDRLLQFNVLAMSGRAVEAAGDVDTLLLDKTGTITFGNRLATEVIPVPGCQRARSGRGGAARQPCRRDARGPLHRALTQEKYRVADAGGAPAQRLHRVLGDDAAVGRRPRRRKLRKGAVDAVLQVRARRGGPARCVEPPAFRAAVDRIARSGGTPLGLADGDGCSASST